MTESTCRVKYGKHFPWTYSIATFIYFRKMSSKIYRLSTYELWAWFSEKRRRTSRKFSYSFLFCRLHTTLKFLFFFACYRQRLRACL